MQEKEENENLIELFAIKEKIDLLENKIFYLECLLKFHKLYEIPTKYKKFNPENGEYPFFEIKNNIKTSGNSQSAILNELLEDQLELPKDAEEFTKAKERMKEYLEKKQVIDISDDIWWGQKDLPTPKDT